VVGGVWVVRFVAIGLSGVFLWRISRSVFTRLFEFHRPSAVLFWEQLARVPPVCVVKNLQDFLDRESSKRPHRGFLSGLRHAAFGDTAQPGLPRRPLFCVGFVLKFRRLPATCAHERSRVHHVTPDGHSGFP
jgi:hypothetical protein